MTKQYKWPRLKPTVWNIILTFSPGFLLLFLCLKIEIFLFFVPTSFKTVTPGLMYLKLAYFMLTKNSAFGLSTKKQYSFWPVVVSCSKSASIYKSFLFCSVLYSAYVSLVSKQKKTQKERVLFLQIYRAFLASAAACFATTTFCKRISSYIGLQACVLHYYIDYYLLLLLVCLVLFWYCCFGVLLLNSKSSWINVYACL